MKENHEGDTVKMPQEVKLNSQTNRWLIVLCGFCVCVVGNLPDKAIVCLSFQHTSDLSIVLGTPELNI